MILAAIALTICAPGPRDNCVVDGDTLWLAGEKIRIEGIDTPELHSPKCPQEALQAAEARDRLITLLSARLHADAAREGPLRANAGHTDRQRPRCG